MDDMIARNFFEERMQAPATNGIATGTTKPSEAPLQVNVGDKGFAYGSRKANAEINQEERVSWREFWSRLSQRGFVDSADTAEYQTRTTELIDQGIVTVDQDTHLFLSKSNALRELLNQHLSEFAFLIET